MYLFTISTFSFENYVIFFYSVSYLFILANVSFDVQKLFNQMKLHVSILALVYWATGILFRKYCLHPYPQCFPSFPSIISSRSCVFFNVYFWFLSQKSNSCNCVVLFLGLLFYSIVYQQFLCQYQVALLLWLCRIIWSQVFC
jgi:hypothetical protein